MENEFQTFTTYINKNIITPNEEDYIEMIYRLENKNEIINNNLISKCLNIKPSSVTKMVKKLKLKNILIHSPHGEIKLTSEGKIIGERLFRKHKIIEEFLLLLETKNNLLEKVEKIEHTIDDESLSKINLLLLFFSLNTELKNNLKEFIIKNVSTL